jgi:hypothetical protein
MDMKSPIHKSKQENFSENLSEISLERCEELYIEQIKRFHRDGGFILGYTAKGKPIFEKISKRTREYYEKRAKELGLE